MNKFFSVFSAELKKCFKARSFIVISIVLVIFLVLVFIMGEALLPALTPTGGEADDPAIALLYYQEQLKLIENTDTGKPHDLSLDRCKAIVAYYQYLVDNNLKQSDAYPYSGAASALSNGDIGFGMVGMGMNGIWEIILIFVIIMAAGNFAGELSNGRMKMLLIRPIDRNKVLSAKWLATFVAGASLMVASTVILMIYALARFDVTGGTAVMVANVAGTYKAFAVSGIGTIFIEFGIYLFGMFAFMQLTYCIGTLVRGRVAALILPLGLLFLGGLVDILLKYIYLGYASFTANIMLMNFLAIPSANTGMMRGMNIIASTCVSVVYTAVFMIVSYLRFNRQDIK